MTQTEPTRGPSGYENWRAALSGASPTHAYELQLYTDAHVVSDLADRPGPYAFHNAVPNPTGAFTHTLTLRMSLHTKTSLPDLSRTDTTRYHGGSIGDEISALCGLLLGIRLRAGQISREFDGVDPRGRPRADVGPPLVPLPPRHGGWIVPRARETHDIRSELLPLFERYAELTPSQAVTLVRAARLYQDALWVAEGQPELAWLLMVSAVEVVATEHQVANHPADEILRLSFPKLHAELDRVGGPSLVRTSAEHLSRLMAATKRFLRFLEDFMPGEPSRPSGTVAKISWEVGALRKALSQIYDYRSRALHDGVPFPRPMCDPPWFAGVHHERPSGLASATNEASWISQDLPMLLHVFEHIARNSIVNWWASLNPLVTR